MILCFNAFRREHEEENQDDEDYEPEQVISEAIEAVQGDILEAEEIRFSNMIKLFADELHASLNLVYSRDIPSLQMEILGIPFKKSRNENQA